MLKIVNSKVMSLLFGLDSCCANYHSFSEGNSIKLSTSTKSALRHNSNHNTGVRRNKHFMMEKKKINQNSILQ